MLTSRRIALGLVTCVIGACIGSVAAPFALAQEATTEVASPAWHAKVAKVLAKAEIVTETVDAQEADEEASLAERLKSLNARLKVLEAEYDLPARRFWLYQGSADAMQFSSFAQMATVLKTRADRARKAKTRRFVEESNERVREEREREEQETSHNNDDSGCKSDDKEDSTTTGGTPHRGPRGPELVRGFLANGAETISLVNVKLAEDLFVEFTVVFPPVQAGETIPTGTAGAQAVAELAGEGKTPSLVEAKEKAPEAEVRVQIVSKEDKTYPNTGKVEFRSESEDSKSGDDKSEGGASQTEGAEGATPDEPGVQKVEGEYLKEDVINQLLGAKDQDKVQILRLKLDGVAFENVVAPTPKGQEEAEPIKLVQGKIEGTAGQIEGKALELLKALLSVYDKSDSAQGAPSPAGAAATAEAK